MKRRVIKAEREILHPRGNDAEYADKLLQKMRKELSDADVLDILYSYIPSSMTIEILEDAADRYLIDISEVD